MNFKFNLKNAFFFERTFQKLINFCAVIFGIFISWISYEKIQALPYIIKSSPRISQKTENSSRDIPSNQDFLSSSSETNLQLQISYYDTLIDQAKTFKQHWNNTGSLSSLRCYNTIIHKIEMINTFLKKTGKTTLPNLPLLSFDKNEEIFEILEDDL